MLGRNVKDTRTPEQQAAYLQKLQDIEQQALELARCRAAAVRSRSDAKAK